MSEKKFLFKHEEKIESKQTPVREIVPWHIAIIDDDEQVHQITTMVLKSFHFDGRPLSFLHAYSEAEGYELFKKHNETIAVCLLDVVMETDHAGLDLTKKIRLELKNSITRIVLRTGQPGQAPEEHVISEYDINDYKEKTELTSLKLRTLMYSCLRGYRDIISLEHTKKGLEEVIDASTKVFSHQYLDQFARGILYQITSILNFEESALYGVFEGVTAHQEKNDVIRIISGIGQFESHIGENLVNLMPEEILAEVCHKTSEFFSHHTDDSYIACYHSNNRPRSILYLKGLVHRDELQSRLLDIFSRNVLVAFNNLYLKVQSDEIQSDASDIIGTALENCLGSAGIYRKRVAEIAHRLANYYGLNVNEVELIRQTAHLIDIGKIGISAEILSKPDELDDDEIKIAQDHINTSLKMLKLSCKDASEMAENMILEHHERWDGSGYPSGKKGDEISLEGRIAAIADVFDALNSPRSYRQAWPIDKAFSFIFENAGSLFDPNIVTLLAKHKDEIAALYKD